MRTFLLASGLLVTIIGGLALRAAGAEPLYRYAPSRPTISPYMNYFIGPDPGVLDRYNAYVRPSLDLQYALRSQNARLGQLGSELDQVRRDERGAGTTGIGGAFMNYSHYYPATKAPRPR